MASFFVHVELPFSPFCSISQYPSASALCTTHTCQYLFHGNASWISISPCIRSLHGHGKIIFVHGKVDWLAFFAAPLKLHGFILHTLSAYAFARSTHCQGSHQSYSILSHKYLSKKELCVNFFIVFLFCK